MMQEPVCRDLEDEVAPLRGGGWTPAREGHLASMVIRVGRGAADGECPEHMGPGEALGTPVEGWAVHRLVPRRREAAAEGGSGVRGGPDRIGVPPGGGAEPGVKLGMHRSHVGYPEVGRQLAVQRALKSLRGPVRPKLDAHGLSAGVHPGVGAPGPSDPDRGVDEALQGRLQLTLHGAAVGLDLPTGEVRSVVLQDQLEGPLRHSEKLSGTRGGASSEAPAPPIDFRHRTPPDLMSSRSLPGLALALGGAASLEAALVALAGVVAEDDRDARLAYLTFDSRAELLRARWTVRDGRVDPASMELSLGQLPQAVERGIREAGAFADVREEPAAYARLLGLTPATADGTLAVRGLAVEGVLHGVLVLWEPRRVFGVRAAERLEPAVALYGLALAKHAALLARDEAEASVETIVERVHAEMMNRSASTERAQAELEEAVRQQARRLAAAASEAAVAAHHLEQAEIELHRRGESLRARTRTLALLERLLAVASATREPAALTDGLLALLGDDLEAARCSLFLVAPAAATLYLAAGRGLPPTVTLGRIVPFGEGVAGQVAVRREPLLVTDAVDAKAQLQTRDDYRTAGSFISFPLVWRGGLHGVVNVGNRVQQGHFTEEDVARVKLLGLVVAAIVVENDLARALWRGEAPPQ